MYMYMYTLWEEQNTLKRYTIRHYSTLTLAVLVVRVVPAVVQRPLDEGELEAEIQHLSFHMQVEDLETHWMLALPAHCIQLLTI